MHNRLARLLSLPRRPSFPRYHSSETRTTVDTSEVEKFSSLSNDWWNPTGSFRLLHAMNPARVKFIVESTANMQSLKMDDDIKGNKKYRPLIGLNAVDIGCGGGILSQSLARLGANVLGIDASAENCKAAEQARQNDFSFNSAYYDNGSTLKFQCRTSDALALTCREKFDIVCAVEVIEHVNDASLFLDSCHSLLKPGGILIMSTMSRNFVSYLMTIALAEHVLQLVPKGTHDYDKYVTFEQFERMTSGKFQVERLDSLLLNPLNMNWRLKSCDRSIIDKIMANYIVACTKI